MPTSVRMLFEKTELGLAGVVAWGEPIPSRAPGVYAIALDADPDRKIGLDRPAFCDKALGRWIERTPLMRLDGERPSVDALREYLSGFWLSDEPIVYLGKATSLRSRLCQFAKHRLGMRSPHAGGHWLKTIATIDSLHVFYAETADKGEAAEKEAAAIKLFADGVRPQTASRLSNPGWPIPFANVAYPGVGRKQRLLVRQTAPRRYERCGSVPPESR